MYMHMYMYGLMHVIIIFYHMYVPQYAMPAT